MYNQNKKNAPDMQKEYMNVIDFLYFFFAKFI